MNINVIYDTSVNNAPAGFKTGIAAAVDFLDKEFTNPVTITIHVGYGEVNGIGLDANALGESFYPTSEPESYSAVRNALLSISFATAAAPSRLPAQRSPAPRYRAAVSSSSPQAGSPVGR